MKPTQIKFSSVSKMKDVMHSLSLFCALFFQRVFFDVIWEVSDNVEFIMSPLILKIWRYHLGNLTDKE